jgi:hypothetical protein
MRNLDFFKGLQSRYQLEELMLYLSEHPGYFPELLEMALTEKVSYAWRIMWAVEKVSQRDPDWFTDDQINRIKALALTTKHGGMQRLCLSILTSFPVIQPLDVHFINTLYEMLLNPSSAIAVQSLAMKLLYLYTKENEDLLREFILTIEQVDENEYTMAFVATKRNILKMHARQQKADYKKKC